MSQQVVEKEPYLTLIERRKAGQPYCPKCFTFGHEHVPNEIFAQFQSMIAAVAKEG